ncbi:MAG: AI-2E family transporter [Chloroflexota bacterium]
MHTTRPRWPFAVKLAISLLVLALCLYLLFRFQEAVPPLILAIVLAFVLTPAVNVLQARLKLARPLAILLCYIGLLGGAVFIPIVVTPVLAEQVRALNLDVQRLLNGVQALLSREYVIGGWKLETNALVEQSTAALQGLMEPVVGQTIDLMVEVISSLVWAVFILVVAFYLIKDGAALKAWVMHLIPSDYLGDFVHLRDDISQIWAAFFRGQLVLALVVALIFSVVGWLIGLPFALAMGILAGLLEFLPSIGHGIWLALATILALFLGSTWLPLPNWAFAVLLIALHIFFQQFDLNYLIPRIIGSRVHLRPLVVILGIVAGATMAGVLGIFLAAPTIASARVLGRYVYANLVDIDPFPDMIAEPLPPPNLRWWKEKSRRPKLEKTAKDL